jgi:uncharacterized repeat protein (TIGR03803 family)
VGRANVTGHDQFLNIAPEGNMKNATCYSTILALVAFAFTLSPTAFAQFTITDLHNFGSTQTDGTIPESAPVLDSAGNLYGVAPLGGANNQGMAYELSPSSTGWTYTDIYDFTNTSTSAAEPSNSLILDAQGNLYGVSQNGGADGLGVVYELSPSSSGWTQTLLYSFAGGSDGASPTGSLIFDASGNLYGTNTLGGSGGDGTVFELSPSSSGWTETILHNFTGGADGRGPGGNLLLDSTGRIYGAALLGGTVNSSCSEGCGTIFRLANSSGTWRFTRLFDFQGTNGGSLPTAIVFDAAGNIYGTAYAGGTGCTGVTGCGVVFKLTPSASGGPWKEKILHAFTKQADGSGPYGIAFDFNGNLYGTTFGGGSGNEGVVWQLSPTTTGPWKFTQVYAFGKGTSGFEPDAGVILDSKGNLYGTCSGGNSAGTEWGTVFELSPSSE